MIWRAWSIRQRLILILTLLTKLAAVVNEVCGLYLPSEYNLTKPSIMLAPLHKGKEAQQHEVIDERSSKGT